MFWARKIICMISEKEKLLVNLKSIISSKCPAKGWFKWSFCLRITEYPEWEESQKDQQV